VSDDKVLVQNRCGDVLYLLNNGAVVGTEETITLQSGTYGRYGEIGVNSNYITNAGASMVELSLPPWNSGVYTEIIVIKPIPNVVKSIVAPWVPWNGIGGGLQYMLPNSINELKILGYLHILGRVKCKTTWKEKEQKF